MGGLVFPPSDPYTEGERHRGRPLKTVPPDGADPPGLTTALKPSSVASRSALHSTHGNAAHLHLNLTHRSAGPRPVHSGPAARCAGHTRGISMGVCLGLSSDQGLWAAAPLACGQRPISLGASVPPLRFGSPILQAAFPPMPGNAAALAVAGLPLIQCSQMRVPGRYAEGWNAARPPVLRMRPSADRTRSRAMSHLEAQPRWRSAVWERAPSRPPVVLRRLRARTELTRSAHPSPARPASSASQEGGWRPGVSKAWCHVPQAEQGPPPQRWRILGVAGGGGVCTFIRGPCPPDRTGGREEEAARCPFLVAGAALWQKAPRGRSGRRPCLDSRRELRIRRRSKVRWRVPRALARGETVLVA